jgi:hypothetical protein
MGLSLMNMFGISSSERIAHVIENACVFTIYTSAKICQSRLCEADNVYLSLSYNGSLVS